MSDTTRDAESPLVLLRGVTRRYPGMAANGAPGTVLEGIDFLLQPGAAVAIMGPSGCGKSTLLNLIGALDQPDEGEVIFDQRPLQALSDRELARLRNREIGFIFQEHHLLPQCSVLENVLVPTLAPDAPLRGSQATARARELLARVGLEERLAHRPGQLSGGERQRVAVVRALINQPRLLLADEPTGSLDQKSAKSLIDLLIEFNKALGVALVLVTHAADIAGRMPRLLTLREGRLREAGRRKR